MITTGFSGNPEVSLKYTSSAVEKPLLDEILIDFTGSSVTATRVAERLGLKAETICLVGPPTSIYSALLELAVNGNGHHVHRLDVLHETSIAGIPFDLGSTEMVKVYGKKGNIVPEKVQSALMQLSTLLANRNSGDILALTGLREEEMPFATEALRIVPKGNTAVTPRLEFCPSLASSGLLAKFDCLVVNEQEFKAVGLSPKAICSKGPRMVVVTEGRKGGHCFFEGTKRLSYSSKVFTERESPGTGDWFMGSILAFMDYHRLSFSSVTYAEFRQALHFAAAVASKKATKPGAKHGPSAAEIRMLLERA